MNFAVSSCFIHRVDSLVGQKAVADIADTCFDGVRDYIRMIGYSMKFFIFFFQSFYNMDGFLNAWFKYIYLLEATHQPLLRAK